MKVVINGFKKCPYDPCLVDVYACGVILWKLLLGQDSWPDRDPEEEKRLHSQEIAEYYKYYLQKQKDGLHLRITPDNKVSAHQPPQSYLDLGLFMAVTSFLCLRSFVLDCRCP